MPEETGRLHQARSTHVRVAASQCTRLHHPLPLACTMHCHLQSPSLQFPAVSPALSPQCHLDMSIVTGGCVGVGVVGDLVGARVGVRVGTGDGDGVGVCVGTAVGPGASPC